MRMRLCIGLGLLASAWSPAVAEVTALVGGAFTYDDNVFRQSKSYSDATGGQPRSDRIYSINGEVDAHFTPGDLDGLATVQAGHNWYDRNSNLDNFNYAANLSLVRKSLDGIGVNVTALSQRQLSSFADVRQRLRNVQELNLIDAETTFPVTPEIRVVVDPSFTQNTNSSDLLRFNDFRQYGIRAGVGWYTPIGNSIAITGTRRYTDGLRSRPVTLTDGTVENGKIDLVDTSVDVKALYNISAFTSVSVFASYVDRNDRSVLNNNYHGPSGSVTFSYAPRDSLQLSLTGGRRLEAQSFLFVDGVRTDFATLTGTAQLGNRFDLQLILDYYRRRFEYDPTVASGRTVFVDHNYRIDAELGYQVTDAIRLAVRGLHEFRRSDFAFGDFHATAIQVSASYAFARSGKTGRNSNRFQGTVL